MSVSFARSRSGLASAVIALAMLLVLPGTILADTIVKDVGATGRS